MLLPHIATHECGLYCNTCMSRFVYLCFVKRLADPVYETNFTSRIALVTGAGTRQRRTDTLQRGHFANNW